MSKKKQDRGPTGGGRFVRHDGAAATKVQGKRGKNGPAMNRRNGEHMLDAAMMDRLVKLIQVGNYKENAAAMCGISRATFNNWLLRGARGEAPFTELLAGVEKAQAEAVGHKVATITAASQKNWQAAAWWLERTNPRKWGRKDALELSGNEDKPIVVQTLKWGEEEVAFEGGE